MTNDYQSRRANAQERTQTASYGVFNQYPLNLFPKKGFDYIPISNWLRLCPFNETTKRWHVPMKAQNGQCYGFVYNWMRKKGYEYRQQIDLALNDRRGLFADDALDIGLKDFWLVADKNIKMDYSLLGDPAEIGIKIAPSFNAPNSHLDILLPNDDMTWGAKPITNDAELNTSLQSTYTTLAKVKKNSFIMKTAKNLPKPPSVEQLANLQARFAAKDI